MNTHTIGSLFINGVVPQQAAAALKTLLMEAMVA